MDAQDGSQFSCSQQPADTSLPFHMPQSTNQNTVMNPFGLSFQPNYPFHSMNTAYNSHVNQHFGPGFSYQGLLDASNTSPDIQKTRLSKGSQPNKNWSKSEDVALTRAWLHISANADIGNNQKNATMWERTFICWKEYMGVDCNSGRNNNSLSCRWGKMQSAVNKFQGIYERLERKPQSGTTPEDMKGEAIRMYEDAYGKKSFNFEHCWEILRKNPKWCSKELTKANEMKRQRGNKVGSQPSPKATQMSNSNEGEDDVHVVDNAAAECDNFNGIERPQGRKGCKEKKRRLNEDKIMVDVLNNLQSTLEKQIRVQQEELELKKEKDKKDFEFREHVLKKEMELKEKVQKTKEMDMKLKEKAQETKEIEMKLKEKAQELREKAERREQQNRIMNQDLNKLSLSLREIYEKYQAQILKEWETNGLFAN